MFPLHVAALHGNLEMSELLLNEGADVDAQTTDGRTALHCALKGDHDNVAQLLLSFGSDVEHQDKLKNRPLHVAATYNSHRSVGLLLKTSIDRQATNGYGWEPGTVAAREGSTDVLRLLLQEHDNLMNSRFLNAVRHGHVQIAELLLDRGAQVNGVAGFHPLSEATDRDDENMAKMLLRRGADPSQPGDFGRTALHAAAERDHPGLILLLLDHGADINAQKILPYIGYVLNRTILFTDHYTTGADP